MALHVKYLVWHQLLFNNCSSVSGIFNNAERLHQTEALAEFLQSSKHAYAELNPAASLDDAEADQIIQELRAELRF